MDESERLICRAALAGPREALDAWRAWRAAHDPATASDILAWAGGYIARHLRGLSAGDPYLEGISRHHWMSNSRKLARAALVLRPLARRFPLLLLKSFGLGSDADAWRVRPLADIDFSIPRDRAEGLMHELLQQGFRPRLDPDWTELTARIMNQRGSWNVVRDDVDLDVHWRVFDHLDDRTNERLVQAWSRPEKTACGMVHILRPEATLCLLAIHHALQPGRGASGLFDIFGMVAHVDAAAAARLAAQTDATDALCVALESIRQLGAEAHPGVAGVLSALEARRAVGGTRKPRRADRLAGDTARAALPFARRPLIHAVCAGFRHRPRVERLAIRLGGPLSRHAIPCAGTGRLEIDPMREPLLGPGWHHLFPHDNCRWAGMPDARLAIRAPAGCRAAITVRLVADAWRNHAFGTLGLFANGRLIATADREASELSGIATATMAHGTVELTLRCVSRRAAPQRGILALRNALLAPVERIVVDVLPPAAGRRPAATPAGIHAA